MLTGFIESYTSKWSGVVAEQSIAAKIDHKFSTWIASPLLLTTVFLGQRSESVTTQLPPLLTLPTLASMSMPLLALFRCRQRCCSCCWCCCCCCFRRNSTERLARDESDDLSGQSGLGQFELVLRWNSRTTETRNPRFLAFLENVETKARASLWPKIPRTLLCIK